MCVVFCILKATNAPKIRQVWTGWYMLRLSIVCAHINNCNNNVRVEETNMRFPILADFRYHSTFSRIVVLLPQTSEIGFSDLCRPFSTLRTSDSRFPDVWTPDWTFLCLSFVSDRPGRLFRIRVYIICLYIRNSVIRYLNSLNTRNFKRFIIDFLAEYLGSWCVPIRYLS